MTILRRAKRFPYRLRRYHAELTEEHKRRRREVAELWLDTLTPLQRVLICWTDETYIHLKGNLIYFCSSSSPCSFLVSLYSSQSISSEEREPAYGVERAPCAFHIHYLYY